MQPIHSFNLVAYMNKLCYAIIVYKYYLLEAFSESCQIWKKERFTKIVNGFYSSTIFGKRYTFDAWRSSEYTSGY